ncbi:hypothetical protein B0E42_17650 [Pseudomonas sp. A25(2017)]|nr:hypothetical protein B0E42_17650 [Pseudomonas sp. A25(2017)]
MGAKLARETGTSVSERPQRLHRGQALLPQKTTSPGSQRLIAFSSLSNPSSVCNFSSPNLSCRRW